MHRAIKLIFLFVISTLIILIIGIFIAQNSLKNKLETALRERLPDSVNLNYSVLDLSLFRNYVEMHNVEILRVGKVTSETSFSVSFKKLGVYKIDYWDYLFNDCIDVNNVKIVEPIGTYYHNEIVPKKEYNLPKTIEVKKIINVRNFVISNGTFQAYDTQTDSLLLDLKNSEFTLRNIHFDKETFIKKVPFEYEDYSFQFEELFYRLNDFENLTTKNSEFKKETSVIRDFRLKTKYAKEKLSSIIINERDHYDIEADSVWLKDFNFERLIDSISLVASTKTTVYNSTINVYRDKLVNDDLRIKPLYSEMLRDLNFHLKLDTISINNANIQYEEKVRADNMAGIITFSDFNATVQNFSNTYKSPVQTIIEIDANFMNHAPLQATWQFDVNNQSDLFLFKAEASNLQADNLNDFTVPNFNKRLEGELDKTYLTISGNSQESKIDFKVKYKHFDVVALKKNGKDKNKILSKVFNLFVSKNSMNGNSSFKEVTKTNIERDKTKSVFNYIWISTRVGLIKALTIE